MSDLLAGTEIRAVDTPPAVSAFSQDAQLNIDHSGYEEGDPQVAVTFTAPTSGRVLVHVGGGGQNNAANDARADLAFEIREDDESGAVVVAASIVNHGVSFADRNGFEYKGRTTLHEGLTAGATYFARCMHKNNNVGSGTTCDLNLRDIAVTPTS